jgi:hypothetical protein
VEKVLLTEVFPLLHQRYNYFTSLQFGSLIVLINVALSWLLLRPLGSLLSQQFSVVVCFRNTNDQHQTSSAQSNEHNIGEVTVVFLKASISGKPSEMIGVDSTVIMAQYQTVRVAFRWTLSNKMYLSFHNIIVEK